LNWLSGGRRNRIKGQDQPEPITEADMDTDQAQDQGQERLGQPVWLADRLGELTGPANTAAVEDLYGRVIGSLGEVLGGEAWNQATRLHFLRRQAAAQD
jgi:hypothetical protein